VVRVRSHYDSVSHTTVLYSQDPAVAAAASVTDGGNRTIYLDRQIPGSSLVNTFRYDYFYVVERGTQFSDPLFQGLIKVGVFIDLYRVH
jgi:hypothetical protein